MESKPIIFSFKENESLSKLIVQETKFEMGKVTIRHFPDQESFVQIHNDVKDRDVIVICGLDEPDTKIMPLLFLLDVVRELGASGVGIVAPYLGYMRQDIRFNKGEAISSRTFAKIVSEYSDWLITIDPHLHRYSSLDEIYSIPSVVLHAMDSVCDWIKKSVENPVLIGPDSESEQWVSEVAKKAGAPYMVLRKTRHGDRDVEISVPDIEKYKEHRPVLVDDIISTARTMTGVIQHLDIAGMKKAFCIGIHGVFAGDGYEALKASGVKDIVTTNTISHETNKIDISKLIAEELKKKFI